MGLLKDWREHAYGLDDRTPEGKQFWLNYFGVEKGIYEKILADPDQVITCTVKELAEKYDTNIELITGFLDGIDDSLVKSNDLENIDEDSTITIEIDKKKLYMNMVSCNAEWLYTLPQWDEIFTKDEQKELYREEKSSHTIVKPAKVGRNDPCPCGSGKKYKKCCGANA
ncbi:MAG: SEC-C domain-containing protein [Eubacterium sp.]|nr:SEC-C domain-containing protein [Eubacterium sp.]